MKKIIFSLLAMLIITGCGIRNEKVVTDAMKFKKDYPEVSDNNPFVYVTPGKIIKLIEEEQGIIFFGMEQDLWCQAVAPILENSIKDSQIDKVYYYNPREIQIDNSAEYQKILLLLDDYLGTNTEGKKVIEYPSVYAVKDGNIIGKHIISHDGKAQFVKLSDEEKQNIKDQYNIIINNAKGTTK